jgi:hypothetical protein
MKPSRLRRWSARFLLLIALSGCASTAAWLRRYTYPPDFNYIPHDRMHTAMWQLAGNVRELDGTLRAAGDIDEEQRAHILTLLASMSETAARLNAGAGSSNHPVLDRNLSAFQRDIELARRGVENRNYVLVGLLPGACVYCHGASH